MDPTSLLGQVKYSNREMPTFYLIFFEQNLKHATRVSGIDANIVFKDIVTNIESIERDTALSSNKTDFV